jgi:hypothetical protein
MEAILYGTTTIRSPQREGYIKGLFRLDVSADALTRGIANCSGGRERHRKGLLLNKKVW